MRKFPTTNAEYRLFDPSRHASREVWDGEDQPAVEIDWYMAMMFTRWLGARYTLPTDAEWEAACRAGTATEFWFGGYKADLSKHMWCDGDSVGRPRSLSEGSDDHQNPWGLFDMHGNVWEWCWDYFSGLELANTVEGSVDFTVPSRSESWESHDMDAYRVFRGGSWVVSARSCRAASRDWDWPDNRYWVRGFRVCLLAPGPVPSQTVSEGSASADPAARRLAEAKGG
jgi:formylglycine-generating enzyme required for sulfatase activity